jgi:hypothetical protein
MLAAELGKLRLSLRRPNDAKENESDDGTDIETLLGDTQRREEESKATPADPRGGIFSLLNKGPIVAVAPVAPEAPVEQKPQWKMTILSPTGSQQYEWTDVKELPQTGAASSTPGATSAATLPLAPVPGLTPAAPAAGAAPEGSDSNPTPDNTNG